MANADSKHPESGQQTTSGHPDHADSTRKKHMDTGEHAKKNTTERGHVVDEGLGMSRYDSTRKG